MKLKVAFIILCFIFMAKFNYYSLSFKEKNKLLNELYSIAGFLRDKQQIINFFKDILTPSEEIMLARRIQIARMLLEGYSHIQISIKLNTGIDTITRVQRWLRGGLGDYVKALGKITKTEEQKTRQKESIETRTSVNVGSLQDLANRYPLYWGLTNAIYKMLSDYNEKAGKKSEKNAKRESKKNK